MTDQVVATRGRTVIAARCGDHGPRPPAPGPGNAGDARAGTSRLSTGRCGEDLAATYLEDIGWQVLERNWRPDHGLRGELDIIALEPGHAHREPGSISVADPAQAWAGPRLVIVEVKTRSSEDFGHPFASIDRDKARRTRLLAILWCRLRENLDFPRFRIDAIGVTGTCETFTFEHLKAVV
mgnify:CR=1 FL=1